MRSLAALALLTVVVVAAAGETQAKVLANGKPAKGLYWQKVEKGNGQSLLLCRSTSSATIQKSALCEKAGAKKP